MKAKINAFIDGLIPLDYLLFGSSFVLFILFVVVAILLRKRLLLGLFFILLGFSILLLGPTLGYIQLHEYIFKKTLTLTSQKKLNFTEALIVKGRLHNDSKRDFEVCKITASVYAVTPNKYINYLKKLKPFQKASILQKDIVKGGSRDFKIIVEPFRYSKDYNISLGADCR